jgi:hypothetical protein
LQPMKTLDDLLDAQAQALKWPLSFFAPDDDERAALRPGDNIKVCRRGERFWLEVVEIDGDLIQAKVANELIYNLLPVGELVQLEWRHVYETRNNQDFVESSTAEMRH